MYIETYTEMPKLTDLEVREQAKNIFNFLKAPALQVLFIILEECIFICYTKKISTYLGGIYGRKIL